MSVFPVENPVDKFGFFGAHQSALYCKTTVESLIAYDLESVRCACVLFIMVTIVSKAILLLLLLLFLLLYYYRYC